jgi:hypothetical protein
MARMTKANRVAANEQIRMNDEHDEAQAALLDAAQRQMEMNDDWDEAEFLIAEAERIMAEEREIAAAQKAQSRLCKCGCGGTPVGKTARFIPGHDGRLKGRLLKEARNENEEIAAHAVEQLRSFGWLHFLVATAKMKKKQAAAARRLEKENEGAEAPLPTPSSLTAEDRARIAALRAAKANSGMRDMTSRQPVNA